MEELEKVELVREKCNVSYEEAREALKAHDYDVLDAIVQLEREAKAQAEVEPTAKIETEAAAPEPEVIEAEAEILEPEVTSGEESYEAGAQRESTSDPSKASKAWGNFRNSARRVLRGGLDLTFVAERNGEELFTVPVLFVVLGLLMWGAAIWLMVIGLFFGFRYRIEGANPVTFSVNEAMNKAADLADDIKRNVA